MRKTTIFFLLTFVVYNSFVVFGQVNNKPLNEPVLLTQQEQVFLHYNSTLLLAGEPLLYKFYSINSGNGKFSTLSKIGYVELLDEENNRIFRHKIDLLDGEGMGDFLIPSTVPSGNYKLAGYTRWMLNDATNNAFFGDLVIVNPYQTEQKKILPEQGAIAASRNAKKSYDSAGNNNAALTTSNFSLSTKKAVYEKRSRVTVNIEAFNENMYPGSFSLSVRKKEDFYQLPAFTAKNFQQQLDPFQSPEVNKNFTILPDLRDQLVTGKITSKNNKEGITLANQSVAFSIPGEIFFLRIAHTREDGTFAFNINNQNFGTSAYLQVLGENRNEFEIDLDQAPFIELTGVNFPGFAITPEMVETIKDRSVYNQIENSFYSVKQDSIVPQTTAIPFYGILPEVYNLDDFTRFPTLQETFVEIIPLARIRRNRSGSSQIELVSNTVANDLKPLLVVDGFPVQDHSDFVSYDARKIKSISILRDKYYLGPQVFQGVIAVESKEGEFYATINKDFVSIESIEKLQEKKIYFEPVYGNVNKTKRIPDYRVQLLWRPMVQLNNDKKLIEFYTSDLPGEYEIKLEGFTWEGLPVSLTHSFIVN